MSGTGVTPAHVTSRDGTRIGYLRRGTGPGLVLVQGAMGTAHHYDGLATALAPHFTVYTPDRRGRGLSPRPFDDGHGLDHAGSWNTGRPDLVAAALRDFFS